MLCDIRVSGRRTAGSAMAGKRKAASIDDELSGSQHSAGSGGQHFSGVRQPAGSEAAGNVTEELIGDVLHTIMRHMTESVATAHQPSDEPRPALDKSRKLEMRSRSFGPTVHSLQRAYSKLPTSGMCLMPLLGS